MGLPAGSAGKEYAFNVGDLGLIPGLERYPGEGILAWRIPWTVQSIAFQRVGHDWVAFTHSLIHTAILNIFKIFYIFM